MKHEPRARRRRTAEKWSELKLQLLLAGILLMGAVSFVVALVVVIGGDDDRDSADPIEEVWPSTTMPVRQTLRHGAVTAWTGTDVLVWAGGPEGEGTGRADGIVFDVEWGDRRRQIPPAPMPPLDEAIGVWDGEELVVVGGRIAASSQRTRHAAAFDPVTLEWRELSPIPSDVGHVLDVAAIDGTVYAVTTGPSLLALDADGTWEERTAPDADHLTHDDQVVAGSGLLVVWRTDDDGAAPGERYDPDTDRWTALPPVPVAQRSVRGSATITDGWLVVWGSSADDPTATTGARLQLTADESAWRPVRPVPDEMLPPIEPNADTPGSQSVEGQPEEGSAPLVGVENLAWFAAVTGDESTGPDGTVSSRLLAYAPASDTWADAGGGSMPGRSPDFEVIRVSDGIAFLVPDTFSPVFWRWN